ncbi:MAG: sulfate adenylyltransferase subunit CysD [Acidimicrobiales bacterium]
MSVDYRLSHLQALEAESIHIIREVAAEFERPGLLFSGGKDSCVMLRLAEKAFWPARVPFAIVHIDTGHNFAEVLDFRDRRVEELSLRLVVGSVQEAIDAGRIQERPGETRNRLQTQVLLETIEEHKFDVMLAGARRDEEKARAKERVFSFRNRLGQWDPSGQRPELWSIYNGRIHSGEHMRAFPISNWTELDVWEYVAREKIELPSMYFAHRRQVLERDGMLLALCPQVQPRNGEEPFEENVRYRTVGDMSCTGAIRSTAATVDQIIDELALTRVTERGATRADDRFSEAAMEDRKKEGYF